MQYGAVFDWVVVTIVGICLYGDGEVAELVESTTLLTWQGR